MLRSFLFRTISIAVLTLGFGSLAAHAQATRTWVSGVGDDANPCSRTAPCKTFAGAISKTAANGEIDVLDPGGFGGVTITKAITIDGGGYGSVLVSGTNGINVIAGANDVVTLRNLSINGIGTGINGIRYTSGKALRVERSNIFGFTTNGIDVSLTTNGLLSVTDTSIRDCGGSGIRLTTTSGAVSASIDNVRAEKCGLNGLYAADHSHVVVSHSIFAFNGNAGIQAESGTGDAVAEVDSCQFSHNNFGLQVSGGVARLTNNHITFNNSNWSLSGGLIFSFGDNTVANNPGVAPVNGSPSPTKM